jgi:hypothetical protein
MSKPKQQFKSPFSGPAVFCEKHQTVHGPSASKILQCVRGKDGPRTAVDVSTVIIRSAIADVLDQGQNRSKQYEDWCFTDSDDDEALSQRQRFLDAVIARIAELQAKGM